MLAQRSPQAIARLAPVLDRKQVVIIGPKVTEVQTVRRRFASSFERVERNEEVGLAGPDGRDLGRIFVRDDVYAVAPAAGATAFGQFLGAEPAPVLMRSGGDWWLNAFVPDDRLLAPLFERVYGRPLEHGEGLRSQRLEVSPEGVVSQNTFSAPAVFEHEPLPVPWTSAAVP
jgi:hypothetical protein